MKAIIIALSGLAGLLYLSCATPEVKPEAKPIVWTPVDSKFLDQGWGAFTREDGVAVFTFKNTTPNTSDGRLFKIPVEYYKNAYLCYKATVKASGLSQKSQSWDGIRIVFKLDTPGGTQWLGTPFPAGSYGWMDVYGRFFISDSAVALGLVMGLTNVTGEVKIKNLCLVRMDVPATPPAAREDKIIQTGHGPGSLRGTMVASENITRADFDVLTLGWNANVVRWPLNRTPAEGRHDGEGFSDYDRWLETELSSLDKALVWAGENKTKVAVDLVSPPGAGENIEANYMDASGDIFTSPAAQKHFVKIWQDMARRYKGRTEIWGFDLVNEPMDFNTAPHCLDWPALALQAGLAVRRIDPNRTLIVEFPGDPDVFARISPLPLDNVVYSFHFYSPTEYTVQGINSPGAPIAYPGEIAGRMWNKEALIQTMEPAITFARKYRVQMYVGEFSAIRWAPGAAQYLADLVDIFETQGWDWSYHMFRGTWDGFSLEHGAFPDDHNVRIEGTDRQKVIREAFAKNQKP